MKCCAEKRACCEAVQKCCQEGNAACCNETKACCGLASKDGAKPRPAPAKPGVANACCKQKAL